MRTLSIAALLALTLCGSAQAQQQMLPVMCAPTMLFEARASAMNFVPAVLGVFDDGDTLILYEAPERKFVVGFKDHQRDFVCVVGQGNGLIFTGSKPGSPS